ncbi:MAG: hypothetical protein IPP19_01140 [Verrucomicrobia bacterium]|nr:hypothetical protein [Verrucomicrobiota bacterium]
MPLLAALRWSWIVGVDLPRLFSAKLSPKDFVLNPLPEKNRDTRKRPRNPAVAVDSTALFLAALKLSAYNPFIAPRRPELVNESGVNLKHPAFKERYFVRLMRRLRDRERLFKHKELVWREVMGVHNAALKIASRGKRLTRLSVSQEMAKNPGCIGGTVARSYLDWLKKRSKASNLPIGLKRVPFDVRAYWCLMQKSGTARINSIPPSF